MNNYTKIKNMTFDEMVDFLDKIGVDDTPWQNEFDDHYCRNCEPLQVTPLGYHKAITVAWCELHGKCKYFPEYDETPSNKEVIRWWLDTPRPQ